MKSEIKEFKVSQTSSTVVECNIISSAYHLDLTPSDAENQDKVIVQKLIKEVANTHKLETNVSKDFKVLIINEVDRLTKEAQAGLRRTMEKYVQRCRLILICENLGKVIQPLRSRCLLVRVRAPEAQEMAQVLNNIAKMEHIDLPAQLCDKIVKQHQGNMRSAILALQTCRMQNRVLTNQI